MPIDVSLGLKSIKAHFMSRSRISPCLALIHADGYILEKEGEVTSCLNFEISCFSSLFLSFVSHICSLTLFDGYLCDSFLKFIFKMVGTRSGISTTTSSEKVKATMKKKNVATRKPGAESNMHGVRVRGLRPSERADGQVGGAIVGSSVPPENPSLSAVRSAMLKKAALSITDITGDVSSSSSSEEGRKDDDAPEEETLTGGSPIESPHKIVQGKPVAFVTPIDNPRDRDSLPHVQEPTLVDAIGGILGLSKEVVKDVPIPDAGARKND